ncbi:MAG: DUF3018 family protein [Boseongicola sp. SB0677_bin_26]|nr:DUF3018 family protein [Boseongicola sp. SB0665_bin_10]MYG28036.1 DUF3018 family protein [Boseongicola sp. SB0677_bin_26]
MTPARERVRRFMARMRERGLKRIQLWVRPEDVPRIQEAARQPAALARLRKEVREEVEEDVKAEIADATKSEGEAGR